MSELEAAIAEGLDELKAALIRGVRENPERAKEIGVEGSYRLEAWWVRELLGE